METQVCLFCMRKRFAGRWEACFTLGEYSGVQAIVKFSIRFGMQTSNFKGEFFFLERAERECQACSRGTEKGQGREQKRPNDGRSGARVRKSHRRFVK